MTIKTLQDELKGLQQKRETDAQVKKLKKQIKAEKFGQTTGGKIFNKIADVGEAGMKGAGKTGKWLFTDPDAKKGKKKKVPSVEDVLKRLPQ